MRLSSYIFHNLCFLIFYNQNHLTSALIGKNVRIPEEGEFPSVVSIGKVNNDSNDQLEINHFCTGVLLTNKDVLTAKHCLTGKDMNNIRITIGTIDLRCGKRFHSIQWISYREWAENRNITIEFLENDIALIRLHEIVSDELKPSSLSLLSSTDLYGLDAVIAGWGSEDVSRFPSIMETVSVKVLSNRICERRVKKVHGKRVVFHTRFLCTVSVPFALLTYGDSGGPLFHNNMVVGVNIGTCLYRGQPCHPGKINLHAGTDYYRNFIEDFINNS